MDTEIIYLYRERLYLTARIVWLALATTIGFFLSGKMPKTVGDPLLEASFVALVFTLVAIAQYVFAVKYPDSIVNIRKYAVVLIDTLILGYFIDIMGTYGIYLFPLYLVVILRSGLDFGISYLVVAIISTLLSLVLLYSNIAYWYAHVDILIAFALAVIIVPAAYWKHLIYVHAENHTVESDDHDDNDRNEAFHTPQIGIAGRQMYKETLQESVQRQNPFALMFISIAGYRDMVENYGAGVVKKIIDHVGMKLTELCAQKAFVAHLGENEFAVIIEGDKKKAEAFAKELIRFVTERYRISGKTIPIEIVIGISHYPEDTKTLMLLGRYADEALKKAEVKPGSYRFYGT